MQTIAYGLACVALGFGFGFICGWLKQCSLDRKIGFEDGYQARVAEERVLKEAQHGQ